MEKTSLHVQFTSKLCKLKILVTRAYTEKKAIYHDFTSETVVKFKKLCKLVFFFGVHICLFRKKFFGACLRKVKKIKILGSSPMNNLLI